mgnify:CR=1 FL=1
MPNDAFIDPETGEPVHTPLSGLALMVFFVYACQCMSTVAVVRRETRIANARFDETYGEFVLPYADVRAASDPEAMLADFLQSTYAAAADLAQWDRRALEREPVAP